MAKKPINSPGTITAPATTSSTVLLIAPRFGLWRDSARSAMSPRLATVSESSSSVVFIDTKNHAPMVPPKLNARRPDKCPAFGPVTARASATSQKVAHRSSVRNSVVMRKKVGMTPRTSAIQMPQRLK